MNFSPRLRSGLIRALFLVFVVGILGFTMAQNWPVGLPSTAPEYIGDRPIDIPESITPPKRSTPEELVQSILEARDRKDMAALSRCSSTTAGRLGLTQIDVARVERDFFDSGDRFWEAMRSSFQNGTGRIETTNLSTPDGIVDARGEIVIALPKTQPVSSIDEFRLPIARIHGQWFLEVQP